MQDDLIFERAVEISDTGERNAYIREECDQDTGRINLITRLVESHLSCGEFMSEAASDLLTPRSGRIDTLNSPLVVEKPGDTIGDCELIEEIGRGGMAIVYRARQSAPIEREVAVKIIKPGLETEQVIARMDLERQTLALMNHPNIATIYDAGITPRGRPYFVMEFVEGISISRYCESNGLDLRQTTAIFIDVCQAVQHAHRRGVIHRDLKPSNILVTELEGRPVAKVIDFGIAKMLLAGEHSETQTLTGQIVGTPRYMSPEQAVGRAENIDTRSDVYALGAVLYELITGEPPLKADTLAGTLERILNRDPVAPTRLNRAIGPDLETICLCCLRKDPDKRYASVEQLKDDLVSFLDGRPVRARKAGLIDRTLMWARRSPAAAGLAAVSCFAVLAFVALWASLTLELRDQRDAIRETARQLESERNIANDNFVQAHKAIRQYLDAVQTHTPLGSSRDLLFQQDLIENGLEFYDELLSRPVRDAEQVAGISSRHEIRLEQINLTMEYGKVLLIARDLGGSVEVFGRAVSMLENVRAAADDTEKIDIKLGSTCISMARTLIESNRFDAAAESCVRAINSLERIDDEGGNAEYRAWFLATAWQRLGEVQMHQSKRDDAMESFETALELSSVLSNIHDFQLTHANSWLHLARFHRATGNVVSAQEASENALGTIEQVCIRCIPTLPRYVQKRVECLLEVCELKAEAGRTEDAISDLELAVVLQTRLTIENPDVEDFTLQLVSLYELLARWSTDPEEATVAAEQARQLSEQIASGRSRPDEMLLQVRLFLSAADRDRRRDNSESEIRRLHSALELIDRIPEGYESDHVRNLRKGINFQLSRAYFSLQDFDKAIAQFDRFDELEQKVTPADMLILAVCYAETGRHDDAAAQVRLLKVTDANEITGDFQVPESAYLPLVELLRFVDSPAAEHQLIDALQVASDGLFEPPLSGMSCRHQLFAICRMIDIVEERQDELSAAQVAEAVNSFLAAAEPAALERWEMLSGRFSGFTRPRIDDVRLGPVRKKSPVNSD
ncbi:MAG: protein kinase [Planctomycetota bacterium]